MIDGAADGFGTPIGSFYVPGSLGYVDTTGINPYDPEKAKKLLAEAGVTTPLELSLKLPPPAYARQGGEVLAAQLAKVGINAKIENVEWAQWLSQVFAPNGPHNFDMTIVSHGDLIAHTGGEGGIERGQRFVENEERRFDGERTGERDAPGQTER